MIFEQIKTEISEISSLVDQLGSKSGNRDRVAITADIQRRLKQIEVLSTEQHVLINARLLLTSPDTTSNGTYADVVKRSNHTDGKFFNAMKTNQTFTVLVQSKLKDQNSTKTITDLKRKIDPTNIGVTISKIKHISNGGIAISVPDKQSAKKLQEAISKQSGFEAKQAKKSNPYIKLLNVPSEITTEEVISLIAGTQGLNECKLAFQTKSKNPNLRGIVLQLSPQLWKTYIEKQFVCISWFRLRVIDYIPIRRCYKCQAFGHIAASCKEVKQICPWCTGHHGVDKCLSTDEHGQCINCTRSNAKYHTSFNTNHPANSNTCGIFKLHKLKKLNSTEYYCDHV